jgi:DNA-binding GntR family transcriptional regulator
MEANRLSDLDLPRSVARDEAREEGTKLARGARILRAAILRGDLKPGQKLKQQDLAESLGMSATPVREVLRILEAEGLLEHIPNVGVFVAEISPEDTQEVTPIRVALETLAVRMYAERFDEANLAELQGLVDEMEHAWRQMDLVRVRRTNFQFHSAIYTGSGSDILRGLIERLWPRFATDLLWMIPGRAEQSIDQHRAILAALKAHDAEAAAKAMADHINTAGSEISAFIARQTGEQVPRAPGAPG